MRCLSVNFPSFQNEVREFHTISHSELDGSLAKFILIDRKKGEEEFEPTKLRSMISSIDRSLRHHLYNESIMQYSSDIFNATNATKQELKTKEKDLNKKEKAIDIQKKFRLIIGQRYHHFV